MKPAERMALRDQLARAMAWSDLSDDQRNTWQRKADRVLTEMETVDSQQNRVGWVFVDSEAEAEA